MMEQDIFIALRELLVLLLSQIHATLRPYRLTPEQYDTLLLLQPDNGWRMGDLSNRLLCDNSKMTRIVDYLAENGWAERHPDLEDRRAQRVFLTAVGATHRTAAQEAHLATLQANLTSLNAAQQTQLLGLLTIWRTELQKEH